MMVLFEMVILIILLQRVIPYSKHKLVAHLSIILSRYGLIGHVKGRRRRTWGPEARTGMDAAYSYDEDARTNTSKKHGQDTHSFHDRSSDVSFLQQSVTCMVARSSPWARRTIPMHPACHVEELQSCDCVHACSRACHPPRA